MKSLQISTNFSQICKERFGNREVTEAEQEAFWQEQIDACPEEDKVDLKKELELSRQAIRGQVSDSPEGY